MTLKKVRYTSWAMPSREHPIHLGAPKGTTPKSQPYTVILDFHEKYDQDSIFVHIIRGMEGNL